MIEPVGKFLQQALREVASGDWRDLPCPPRKDANGMGRKKEKEMVRRIDEGSESRGKRVWFVKGGLQTCKPSYPSRGGESVGLVGEARGGSSGGFGGEGEVIYDAWVFSHACLVAPLTTRRTDG